MSTVLFLHAHPDDEAIFTGGTIARLAQAGHRVVVVFATSGELGDDDGRGPAALADRRRREAEHSCELLGAARVVFLDHVDSGISDDPRQRPWGAFTGVSLDVAVEHVAAVGAGERADALVTYDEGGVYGHPDHVQAHRVGAAAAAVLGLPTWYEVTVDREYLHFVDTHVAAAAGASLRRPRPIGLTTVEISTVVDVHDQLAVKHAAIAAHESQVGADATFGTGPGFAEVYGWEWFMRHGAMGAIDELSSGAAFVRQG